MYDKKEFPIFVGTKLKKCMIESERQQIIELIKKEVIPAIGCTDRKSTRLNSSHMPKSRMPSSA